MNKFLLTAVFLQIISYSFSQQIPLLDTSNRWILVNNKIDKNEVFLTLFDKSKVKLNTLVLTFAENGKIVYDYETNSKYDETTRLRLSWAKLKTVGKAFKAKPCVKRYLFKHVDSRFLEITADEWDIAALLPFQNFQGATANKVYNDSRNKF
jgi:hypothetical protein